MTANLDNFEFATPLKIQIFVFSLISMVIGCHHYPKYWNKYKDKVLPEFHQICGLEPSAIVSRELCYLSQAFLH